MDLERLHAIIDWMERSPLAELEVTEGDFHVRLVRQASGGVVEEPADNPDTAATGSTIVSTSYGIVHLTPASDAPAFVSIGDKVVAGQQVCVIEAMKVFTPLETDRAGIVVAILVTDGAEVSAGQALFRLD